MGRGVGDRQAVGNPPGLTRGWLGWRRSPEPTGASPVDSPNTAIHQPRGEGGGRPRSNKLPWNKS